MTGGRILIVEDDHALRDVLLRGLRDEGLQPSPEGVGQPRHSHPDSGSSEAPPERSSRPQSNPEDRVTQTHQRPSHLMQDPGATCAETLDGCRSARSRVLR